MISQKCKQISIGDVVDDVSEVKMSSGSGRDLRTWFPESFGTVRKSFGQCLPGDRLDSADLALIVSDLWSGHRRLSVASWPFCANIFAVSFFVMESWCQCPMSELTRHRIMSSEEGKDFGPSQFHSFFHVFSYMSANLFFLGLLEASHF